MDTCPFMRPLIPLFWTSGDISSGFQSQSGFCLIWTCGGIRNTCSLESFLSVADLGGMRGVPPQHPNTFDFMQFSGKFAKLFVGTPPLGNWHLLGKSWICHLLHRIVLYKHLEPSIFLPLSLTISECTFPRRPTYCAVPFSTLAGSWAWSRKTSEIPPVRGTSASLFQEQCKLDAQSQQSVKMPL